MPSIIGEKYHNAADTSSGGWAVTDKLFGYLDKAGEIYNDVRYPKPGDPEYDAVVAKLRQEQLGMFGLPKPWGELMFVGGIGLLAFGVYKLVS